MKQTEGRSRAGIIAVLVLVVAAAIVMIRAGQLLAGISGATDLAADAHGHVWLALNGELLRLSPTGAIESRFDLNQLGVGKINTIVPMPDGDLWIGSLTHENLLLFSPQGKRLAVAQPPATVGPIFGTFHAAYEPGSDHLVVADTQNHRLLAFDGRGKFIGANASSLDLRFPNDLVADGHGDLLLADTNRNEIKLLKPDLSLAGEAAQTPRFTVMDGARRWFSWPVWVGVAPDGRSYVSWHESNLQHGAVLAYSAHGEFLHALQLGPSPEPQGLLALADDVLVAVKSGEDFKLLHFDRQGRALGAFGSPALQSRLAAASVRATFLRRLQQGGRWVVILGALGLLVFALRFRKQQEASASAAVIHLQREAPQVRTPILVAMMVAIVVLLVLVQAGGLGAAVALIPVSRAHHAPGLVVLVRVVLPVLAGLVVFVVTMSWRSTRTFLDLQMRMEKQRLRSWAPYLPAVLRADESVEDFSVAPSLWRARLLITTNKRLLLLGSAGASSKPIWEAPLQTIRPPHALPKAWWLGLLNPSSKVVEIAANGAQRPLRFYALNRWHLQQLSDMIAAACTRFSEHPAKSMRPDANTTVADAIPARSPLRSAVLSLLLPGLGQLDQGRLRHATGLMFLALGILSLGLVSWITYARRFSDQAMLGPMVLAVMYAITLAYGAWDALRYARETGSGSARS